MFISTTYERALDDAETVFRAQKGVCINFFCISSLEPVTCIYRKLIWYEHFRPRGVSGVIIAKQLGVVET